MAVFGNTTFRDVFNVRSYGAVGDGVTDDTAAIEAAWAASAPFGPLYFPAGNFVYNGSGLTCGSGYRMTITGAGREVSTIVLGPNSRLIDVPAYLSGLLLADLSTIGGKGAFRSRFTGENSGLGQLTFSRCGFRNYTEAAISSNSPDFPFWRIHDCDFYGIDSVSIGIALSGWNDASAITDCYFGYNRINLKLRGAGTNLSIDRCSFLRFIDPSIAGISRIDVWCVPFPAQVNAGDNCIIRACRFGNEGLVPGDYRVLYADEDKVGADNATRFPVLNAASSGFVVGHRYTECGFYGAGTTPLPLVYSTTPNVLSCTYGPLFCSGTQPSTILQFRTPPPVGPLAASNVFGPLTGDFLGIYQLPVTLSNTPGSGMVIDPNDLLTVDPSLPLASPGAGDPVNYIAILATSPTAFSITGKTTVSAAVDAYGGADAALLSIDANGYAFGPITAPAIVAGNPAWIEFDMKAGGATPLGTALVQIAENGSAATHWQRNVAIGPRWVRHRYRWTPQTAPATANFIVSSTTTGTLQLGRVRIYHAREPLNVDGRQLAVRSAGVVSTRQNTAPADSTLANGEAAFWLDPTPGASKLMIRARDSAGKLLTGSVPLS